MRTNCLNCSKEFEVQRKEINRGLGKFCSCSCSSTYNNNKRRANVKPNVKCAYCNKEFFKCKSKQEKSKSGLFFCSREHKDLAQRIGGISEIMPFHYGHGKDIYQYRQKAIKDKGLVCERCGWQKNKAGIVVHHKDRDRNNNSIENLEVLCACCHYIEHLGGADGGRSRNFTLQG